MKVFGIIIFLTLFCTCKNTNSGETPKHTEAEVDTLRTLEPEVEEETLLYAFVDKLRLRKEPGAKGAVLEQIKEGEKIFFLNEETDFKEKIKLRNEWFEAPWLKVKSLKGNTGWVFGGAVTKEAPKEDFTKTPYDDCEMAFVTSRNYEARFNCYQEVSARQLTKDSRYIKQTKTGYQVTLLSGKTRNLVNDNSIGGEYQEYEYRYYLEKMGFFVFRINRFEAGDFILMNDKYGYATPIYGMPKISPDLKKLIVTNADGAAGFEFNGIQLLEMSDEGIVTLFEEEIDGFEPHAPVWIDDKTVAIDFLPLSTEPNGLRVKAKLLMDEEGEWNLTISNRRE